MPKATIKPTKVYKENNWHLVQAAVIPDQPIVEKQPNTPDPFFVTSPTLIKHHKEIRSQHKKVTKVQRNLISELSSQLAKMVRMRMEMENMRTLTQPERFLPPKTYTKSMILLRPPKIITKNLTEN